MGSVEDNWINGFVPLTDMGDNGKRDYEFNNGYFFSFEVHLRYTDEDDK